MTYVKELKLMDSYIEVVRDADTHLERISLELPAVVSVTGEINSPKLPTLIQIRRAFRKPLNKYSLADLNLSPIRSNYEDYRVVTVKRKNVLIEGENMEEVAEKLVENLVREGVVKV